MNSATHGASVLCNRSQLNITKITVVSLDCCQKSKQTNKKQDTSFNKQLIMLYVLGLKTYFWLARES